LPAEPLVRQTILSNIERMVLCDESAKPDRSIIAALMRSECRETDPTECVKTSSQS